MVSYSANLPLVETLLRETLEGYIYMGHNGQSYILGQSILYMYMYMYIQVVFLKVVLYLASLVKI